MRKSLVNGCYFRYVAFAVYINCIFLDTCHHSYLICSTRWKVNDAVYFLSFFPLIVFWCWFCPIWKLFSWYGVYVFTAGKLFQCNYPAVCIGNNYIFYKWFNGVTYFQGSQLFGLNPLRCCETNWARDKLVSSLEQQGKLLPSDQVRVVLFRTALKMGCNVFQYDFISETNSESLKQVKKCLWLPGQPTTAGSFLSWSQLSVSNRCSHPALWPVYRLHPFYVYFDILGKMCFCTLDSQV